DDRRDRPFPGQERRAGLAVAGSVSGLQAGDAPGLRQLSADGALAAAPCQQARGLGPAAGAAELLGAGDDEPLVGSQLEAAGELGLAVGLASQLAIARRAVLVQHPVLGPGGDQAVEIPEGLGPAAGPGAVDDAVKLEVEEILSLAEPLGLLVIEVGLVEPVGQGPGAAPTGVEGPVVGPGGDQTVEVPDRGEGVAGPLGLDDHRLVARALGVGARRGGD